MTTISGLSGDFLGEIFSRVPLTSLSAVRSTCKRWNFLSKNHILGEKASRNHHHQFLEFMVIDSRVFSLRLDLQGIRNEDNLVDPSVKQISIPNNNNQFVQMSQVYHCDGLLLFLCITGPYDSKLVVWNPYLGQTKLIRPRNQFHQFTQFDSFAIGYDINRNHKILRFYYDDYRLINLYGRRNRIDVYDFGSDSWKVLDVNSYIPFCHTCVSLKGNSYFLDQKVRTLQEPLSTEVSTGTVNNDYLLCFDFTTETFGTHLPLPFNPPSFSFDTLALSWVRDEKLAVLYNHSATPKIIEVWISTKIEPNAVSWSASLRIDMTLINGLPAVFSSHFKASSFFIDEEKKVVVLFTIDRHQMIKTSVSQMACIVGEDGYFKSINIGLAPNLEWRYGELVGSSYVPSLVQLQV